jgi:DnaJ-class molecular chaperone
MNESTTPQTGAAVAGRASSELLCGKCGGDGRLRNNKWKDGVYTFGSIECDECGGAGVEPHNA